MATSESLTFRTVLRRHRVAAGLSQEELAEQAGLSIRAISDLERGVKLHPRPYTARRLAEALCLPTAERTSFLQIASGVVPEPVLTEPPATRATEMWKAPDLVIGAFLGSLPVGALVARDAELGRIMASVEAVEGGAGRLVMLAGEAGVGKTRLAQEVSVIVRDRGFVLATGRCYDGQRAAALSPFLEVMSGLYAAASPPLRDDVARRWPYLVRLLPGQPGASPRLDNPEVQRRLFWAVAGFVSALAEIAPVGLLFDDLHWADTETLDLLAHLVRHTHSRRVLLLGTFREREAVDLHSLHKALYELDREGLLQRIAVERLQADGTAALMAVFMGGSPIPARLALLVHERTDGNAFFVQQVVRDLMERQAASESDTDWTIALPESVRAAIGHRVGRLSEQTREVLLAASVLGYEFSFDALQGMTDRAEAELENGIREATAAGLVREVDAETYAFDHVLTQQALYVDLSGRRRRKLHLAAGRALEGLPERQQSHRAAELAWHFRHADDAPRALTWTMRAGEQAEAVFAWHEAERHHRTAVELARDMEDQTREVDAWERLGVALQALARHADALAALERAAELQVELGNRDAEGRVVARIARIHTMRGTVNEGISRIWPVLGKLTPLGSSPSLSAL